MDALVTGEQEATIICRERLRLLAIGYYVSGGLGALFASFFLIYVIMLGAISFVPAAAFENPQQISSQTTETQAKEKGGRAQTSPEQAKATAIIFRIFAGVMGLSVILGWVFAELTIYAGYCLQKRRGKVLIFMMGILNMLWIPYGTLLGIATLLTINTEAAKREFGS